MDEPPAPKAKQQRMIGIDYGMARIGVALSDPTKLIASPLVTLQAEKKLELTAAKLVAELTKMAQQANYEIEGIVIGLPLLLNGKLGALADEVQLLAELMRKLCTIPIHTWDERLTSVQADRSLREGHMNRKNRSKVVDKVAAVILLQNYLDYLRNKMER